MAWIAAPTTQLIVQVLDANGKTATTNYFLPATETDPAAGGALAIADAVQDLTSGWVTTAAIRARAVNNAPGVASTGPYDSVDDKLNLEFSCADGSTVVLQLPGPLANTLAADNFHVNPAAVNVAALVAAMVLNGKSASGAAITGLAGGYRRMPPRTKKG